MPIPGEHRRYRSPPPWSTVVFLLVLCSLGASGAMAQQSAVQGIVLDVETGQPLLGASVVLERSGEEVRSILTDRAGLFQIVGVAPGSYVLRITLLGYTPHQEPIELAPGERITANRQLVPDPLQLEGVRVATEGPGPVQRELGGQTITGRDMRRIPTPGAVGDLVTYLRTLPGVVGTGDRGGQLFIRGGTPSENLVLMDGMLVYQPFHITGFFSLFPEDLVHQAEFFPGGFGPKYNGRISSVLDVQMRDGNWNDQAVSAALSPFLAEVIAEGPIGGGERRNAWLVSLRRSLIRETSPWLLGQEEPLGFNSVYMKLSTLASDGASRCSVTAMRSDDEGGLDPGDERSRVGWNNLVLGGRCTSLAGETFVEARVSYSRVSGHAITRGASEFTSTTSLLSMNGDASRTIGRVRLNFGAFTHVEGGEHDFVEFFSGDTENSGWQGGGLYAEADIPLTSRLRILPGATGSWYPASFSPSLEPRLRAAWRPRGVDGEELNAAVGLYTQRIAGVSDRRDASSVFTAWMAPPDGARLEAIHAQWSWQQPLGGGFSWSIDGYYRWMRHLPITTWTTAAEFEPELSIAAGRAHGGDLRVEYRGGPLYLYGGYGYSRTTYESSQESFGLWFGEPVQRYDPPHDRRHQANVLGSLELGRYTLAARWEYGSGFPFTRPLGFDETFDFRTLLPNVRGNFGNTRLLLDRPYNGRLPPSHRLDLSVGTSWDLRLGHLALQGGLINAYDQRNLFYYDVFTNRRVDQLPIAPYLTVRLRSGNGRTD